MSYRKSFIFILFLFLSVLFTCSVNADAVDTITDNLNMSLADIIMLVVTCGIIVISALDARIALMCAFLIYTSLFILFTLMTEDGMGGFNPYFSGVAMMLCFVVLVLSLLISYKKANTPLNVV